MPGTTRYSATFDRTYEEDDRVDQTPPTNARRSRSLSLQANSGPDGRHYTPFGGRPPTQRSSSTDNGPPKGPEHIPTRTAKTAVKAHNNPFQFVKVGTCPLYMKAEEQLKKAKEVKKPEVLKEEEEEWQSNLDSWKSRRRKMSEDVFRRQEEIKLLELEEQVTQATQKKTKTFSEMVESRATRGRALSLCLISSPLEFKDWEFENKTHKNGSCSFTDESEGNSTVNSEDEGVSIRVRLGKMSQSDGGNIHRTNGDAHIEQNGTKLKTTNGDYKKLSDLSTNNVQMKPKENSYIDSGLESISSSHRAGDTPDSGSDFSPDSNSSIDCDSPRTGVNILEEFTSKAQVSQDHEIAVKLTVQEKGQDFGFTFLGGKDEGQVLIASLLDGSKAETSGIQLGDRIISIDGNDVSCKKHIEIVAMIQKGREKGEISLLLWRSAKSSGSTNGFKAVEKPPVKPNIPEIQNAKSYEKSVESENEMYVDDFEELQRQSELLASSKNCEKPSTIAQNTNSQKVNIPAKQSEELKNSNVDTLNIVFQSQPKNSCLENQSNVNKNSEVISEIAVSSDMVSDVPPVEKVAEEMEKLILEQLEEEERAKELALGMKGSPDHFLTAPPKLTEPPKEKPPPPPSANEGNQKETPLKRVNSTKRIKKEIHKRRSNFLGIDNADESISNNEASIPPPPALEEILKAEMELDRQSRLKIESASTERLSLEEKEIMQKEREIIESLESEERQRQLINGTDDMKTFVSDNSSDVVTEHDRIESLKFERKRLETERLLTEEQQQIHILEEKQLREREEFIRKQEANKQAPPLSDSSLSVSATAANISKPAISSLTPDTKISVSLSGANGDGKSLTNSSTEISEIKTSECAEKKVAQKPAVPPKPLKKKEAIRKERERLRQEQEALQREREEHRRKLLEQEELAKQQKSHGTLTRKFFTIAVVLTVIPMSLYHLFSYISNMHA